MGVKMNTDDQDSGANLNRRPCGKKDYTSIGNASGREGFDVHW